MIKYPRRSAWKERGLFCLCLWFHGLIAFGAMVRECVAEEVTQLVVTGQGEGTRVE